MSNSKTVIVAAVLCIVCSILVSSVAVGLKPIQMKNKDLDMKKNILMAAGLYQEGDDIDQKFQSIQPKIVDLSNGQYSDIDPSSYDSTDVVDIPKSEDVAGLGTRPKLAKIYVVENSDGIEQVILPVVSKGLWSTMYGFLALSSDMNTVKGFGYYSQGETPGLGAEVENPKWKSQWIGKKVFNDSYQPVMKVAKGTGSGEHEVDGLSGATITCTGVTTSMQYWLGNHGYGKYLAAVRGGTL